MDAGGSNWDNRYAGMQWRDFKISLDPTPNRRYSWTQARWLTPDGFTGGPVDAIAASLGAPSPAPPGPLPYADILNPQLPNKYQYACNNPTRHIDPTVHAGVDIANSIDQAVDVAVASLTSTASSPTGAFLTAFAAGFTGDLVKGAADVLRLGEGTYNARAGAEFSRLCEATVFNVRSCLVLPAPATATHPHSQKLYTSCQESRDLWGEGTSPWK